MRSQKAQFHQFLRNLQRDITAFFKRLNFINFYGIYKEILLHSFKSSILSIFYGIFKEMLLHSLGTMKKSLKFSISTRKMLKIVVT
jgi:hypothetical protein